MDMALNIVPSPDQDLMQKRKLLLDTIDGLPLQGAQHLFPNKDTLDIERLGHLAHNLETMVRHRASQVDVRSLQHLQQFSPQEPRQNHIPDYYQGSIDRTISRGVQSHFESSHSIFPLTVLYGVLLGATIPPVWIDQAVSFFTGSDPYPHIAQLEDGLDTLSLMTNRISAVYELNGCEGWDKVGTRVWMISFTAALGALTRPIIKGLSALKTTLTPDDLVRSSEDFQRRYRNSRLGKLASFTLQAAVLATAGVGVVEQHYLWQEADLACAEPAEPVRFTKIEGIKSSSLDEYLLASALSKYQVDIPLQYGEALPTQVRNGALEVYFPTAGSSIRLRQLADIQLTEEHMGFPKDLVIEGHADQRGDVESNYQLGRRRAEAVAQVINTRQNRKITIVSVGEKGAAETTSEEQLALDRKARVVFYANPVELGIQRMKADNYLIDTSETMQPYWSNILQATFPSPAVFVPGENVPVLNFLHTKTDIDLYKSLAHLLRATSPNQSLTVVTAGNSRTAHYEEVRQISRDRSIALSVVGLGLSRDDIQLLGTLAQETGGSTYLIGNN